MADLALEQQNRRLLDNARRNVAGSAVNKVTDEAVDKLKKEAIKLARQAALRTINIAFAATLVGIGVTYLIMSFQMFAGNLMGNELIQLEPWEVLIWWGLSILLIAALLLVLTFIAFLSDPWQATITIWQSITDWLFN